MKKNLFFALFTLIALSFASCDNDDDEDTGTPGKVTITEVITDNSVAYHAESKNAISFAWNLGNGETPSGQDVVGTYNFPGTYTVTCTATGRDGNTVGTKDVVVAKGNPEIISPQNVFLSGYDIGTGESMTTWVWATGAGNMSCGEFAHEYDTCYFNPIDESWWQSTDASGDEAADPSVFDDEYTFKLNSSMEYVNNFGTEFMYNWMYAATAGIGGAVEIWGDVAYDAYEAPTASWSVEFIENGSVWSADSASFTTVIGDKSYNGALVIHLTNGAYMGYAAATHDYQICSYINDTLLIRYDNRVPDNIGDYFTATELEAEDIVVGSTEWDYFKLVKKQ